MEGRVYLVGVSAGAGGEFSAYAGDIVGGGDENDTGKLASAGNIDAEDGGVGVGAAEEGCVEEAGNLEVVEVKAIPFEEPVVLKAPKRLADICRRGTPPSALVKIITTSNLGPSSRFA